MHPEKKTLNHLLVRGSAGGAEVIATGDRGSMLAEARKLAEKGPKPGEWIEVIDCAKGRKYFDNGGFKQARDAAEADGKAKAKADAAAKKAADEAKLADLQAEIDKIKGTSEPKKKVVRTTG